MLKNLSGNIPEEGRKDETLVDATGSKLHPGVDATGSKLHPGDFGSICKGKLMEGREIAMKSLEELLLRPIRRRQRKWTERYEIIAGTAKGLSHQLRHGGSRNNYSFTVHAQDEPEGGQDESLENKIAAQNCQKFSYKTLYDATNEFASQNVLGQGGFGLVYKGKLDDGGEIAVKKSLGMSKEQTKALIREVELLSRVKHPNVVKLLGYCADDNQILLVYEFVPNKSLDKLLFGDSGREPKLDWAQTYGIIVGIAKGLSYLHADPQNCIIHRDIKAENILLNHKWVPKIADFGISRLFDADQTHAYTCAVGTWGHIAPEYIDHGYVTVKVDVYSFGVLVLGLISGKRYSFKPPSEDNAAGLLDWAYKLFKAGRISDIMDPALAYSAVIEEVANCIEIGLRCTQGDPKSRPNMEHVVIMLTGNQGHREMSICTPGIYGYRGYHLGSLPEATQNKSDQSGEVSVGSETPLEEDRSRESNLNTFRFPR